jgi:hypothetical protein
MASLASVTDVIDNKKDQVMTPALSTSYYQHELKRKTIGQRFSLL